MILRIFMLRVTIKKTLKTVTQTLADDKDDLNTET